MNPSIASTLDPDSALDPRSEPGPIGPIPDDMSSLPDSNGLSTAPIAGAKRPAPSLLPAFEPRSSSPSLPRAPKRRRVSPSLLDHGHEIYPTPVPTSSTGVVPSSPVPPPSTRLPGNSRATSTFSERAPLSAVPSIELDEDGEPTRMGRSSHSSDYQLSTNSLVSRVHIEAVYVPAEPPEPAKIRLECKGWNGAKIHCQGKIWELRAGDTFTCGTEGLDIMVDVQDARVMVNWPRRENQISTPSGTGSPWYEDNSPRPAIAAGLDQSPSQSPLRQQYRLQSPVSPSPAVQAVFPATADLLVPHLSPPAPIHVYEDEDCSEIEQANVIAVDATQSTQYQSQLQRDLQSSQSTSLSDPFELSLSENDEENDPVVHSFGLHGANILPRMEAVTTSDPDRRHPLEPIAESTVTSSFDSVKEITCPVTNHVVNQLAYSRLSSTPLSNLMEHLPSHLKSKSPGSEENADLTLEALEKMLEDTDCVGKVEREGKDAAGKPLESEYYYVPEMDSDETRRDTVDGLQKPGLRNCRKQHKQYFWRRPKI